MTKNKEQLKANDIETLSCLSKDLLSLCELNKDISINLSLLSDIYGGESKRARARFKACIKMANIVKRVVDGEVGIDELPRAKRRLYRVLNENKIKVGLYK